MVIINKIKINDIYESSPIEEGKVYDIKIDNKWYVAIPRG